MAAPRNGPLGFLERVDAALRREAQRAAGLVDAVANDEPIPQEDLTRQVPPPPRRRRRRVIVVVDDE